ncbi:ATP synthase F1 subunit epsilon [Candidatus Saccharibacteria bacterium]|nr:ATP synthase F1 subunit epsilon [Candidatus Saccharibacteria bacterium]
MKLELITLDGVKIDNDVYEVLIPTPDGVIAVMPGHERIVTLAVNGVISIRQAKNDTDDQMEHFATYGGMVAVSPTGIRILVDEADTADDIIEEEARAALERATKLRESVKDLAELEKAKAEIDRHAVRLKVAGLRRRRR